MEEIQSKVAPLNAQKKKLENERDDIFKKDNFIKKNVSLAATIFPSIDKLEAEKIKTQINDLNTEISKIKNKIRKEENRKSKSNIY